MSICKIAQIATLFLYLLKKGYELKDKYTCVEYVSVFIKRSYFDKESNKAGSNPSDNLAMSAGAYCAVIGLSKLYQLCGEISIVCPTERNITKIHDQLKKDIMNVSEKQLNEKRKEFLPFLSRNKHCIQ